MPTEQINSFSLDDVAPITAKGKLAQENKGIITSINESKTKTAASRGKGGGIPTPLVLTNKDGEASPIPVPGNDLNPDSVVNAILREGGLEDLPEDEGDYDLNDPMFNPTEEATPEDQDEGIPSQVLAQTPTKVATPTQPSQRTAAPTATPLPEGVKMRYNGKIIVLPEPWRRAVISVTGDTDQEVIDVSSESIRKLKTLLLPTVTSLQQSIIEAETALTELKQTINNLTLQRTEAEDEINSLYQSMSGIQQLLTIRTDQ